MPVSIIFVHNFDYFRNPCIYITLIVFIGFGLSDGQTIPYIFVYYYYPYVKMAE